jgi:hypothetical protein
MNVRRGLFRIWAIASAMWVAACLWLRHDYDYSCFLRSSPWCDYWEPYYYVQAAATMIGPPVIALLLGWATLWIVAGFRANAKSN